MSRRLLIVMFAASSLVVGACGDDVAEEDGAETTEAGAEGGGTTVEGTDAGDDERSNSGGGGEEVTATIEGMAFSPSSIEIDAGTTIVWTNEDSVSHTVTAGTPGEATGEFDESVGPGETVEITLEEPGTYAFYCAIHPGMTGEIVVS